MVIIRIRDRSNFMDLLDCAVRRLSAFWACLPVNGQASCLLDGTTSAGVILRRMLSQKHTETFQDIWLLNEKRCGLRLETPDSSNLWSGLVRLRSGLNFIFDTTSSVATADYFIDRSNFPTMLS